jgi:hypothetical protein
MPFFVIKKPQRMLIFEKNNAMRTAKIVLFGLAALLTPIFHSCVEEEPKIVPDVYVDFYVNLDLPEFTSLNAINNAVKVANQGYDKNGIIIYRYTQDEFLAFDATCPQHIGNSTSVDLDDNGAAGTATCSHCNAIYRFMNLGYPDKGYPLKRYSVTVSGRILRITN